MFARLLLLIFLTPAARAFTQPSLDRDSIHLAHVLDDALHYAAKHSRQPFHVTLEDRHPEDSSFEIKTELRYGHLFSSTHSHLVVNRNYTLNGGVDVYLYKNGHFHHVISGSEDMPLLDSKIRDINGDGWKDIVTHWYSLSGCCRRNVYHVFLYLPASGTFTRMYEFMNPTFSPTEKLIRGVLYGHPGETPLYKFRWNGLKIDTVEYIYPLAQGKGFVKTHREVDSATAKDGSLLKAVPKEYRHITDYDWFVN